MAATLPAAKRIEQAELSPEEQYLLLDSSPEAEIDWIETFLTIDSKDGFIVPFQMYPQQKQMAYNRTGRDNTVKGRQTRASSYILARNLRRMTTGQGLKCLASGTEIRLVDGQSTFIEHLRPGDFVYTHFGRRVPVSLVWSSGVKQTIQVCLAGEKVICTPDHRWFTTEGWQEARTLRGAWISIPARSYRNPSGPKYWALGRRKRGHSKNRKRSENQRTRHLTLNQEFGWVVGLFLAEGTVTKSGLTFSLHESERGFVDRLIRLFSPMGMTVIATPHPRKRALRVDVFDASLADLFQEKLYRGGVKVLPDIIWETVSMTFPRGVLEGFIDGDGSLAKTRPTITVGQQNRGRLLQLRDLAQSLFGVWGTVYTRGKPHGYSKQIQHLLVWDSWAGEELRRQYGWPEFRATQHPRSWKRLEGHAVALKVKSLTEVGMKETWDVEVAHPDHSFRTLVAPLKNCLVMTQDDQTTATFRARIKHHLTDLARHGFEYKIDLDNDNELVIAELENRYIFGSGQEKVAGRAYTGHLVHLSEFAHWPEENARKLLGAISPSVPGAPNGWFDIESTPNGAEGPFYEGVISSNIYEPLSRWSTHFYPWWMEPGYRAGTSPDCDILYGEDQWAYLLTTFKPAPDEEKLMEEQGLDVGQILWRRVRKVEQDKTDAPFLQEYPESINGCFLTAGGNYFASPQGVNHLEAYRQLIREPLERKAHLPFRGGTVEFHGQNFYIWQHPQVGEPYVLWVDCAGGGLSDDADFSAIIVLNAKTMIQVARLNIKVAPQELAPMAVAIATYYNNALLGGERDAFGSVCVTKVQELFYRNLWYYIDPAKPPRPDQGPLEPWGHPTQIRDKILTSLRERVLASTFTIFDSLLLQQMGAFTWQKLAQKRHGLKAAGKPGLKDDLVMCAAGACFIATQAVSRYNARKADEKDQIVVVGQSGIVLSRQSRSRVPKPWLR